MTVNVTNYYPKHNTNHLWHVTYQEMHISNICVIIIYSPTCFGRFCGHHNVIQEYKPYTNSCTKCIIVYNKCMIHNMYNKCIIKTVNFIELFVFLYDIMMAAEATATCR